MKLHFQSFTGNTTKTAMIVLHGLFGSSSNWRTLCKQFAANRDVFAVDLRNHGQSPHSAAMSFEDMAGDILEFIETEKLEACILLGHSMGGKVAMEVALTHSMLIERLIVADIAPKEYPPRHQNVFAAIELIDNTQITERNQADLLIKQVLPDHATRLFLLTNLVSNSADEYIWRTNMNAIRENYAAISAAPPAIESNNHYDRPSLFIRGENSAYIKAEDEDIIRRLFPNSTMATIREAGHWVHTEQPEQFFTVVEDFLNRNSGHSEI